MERWFERVTFNLSKAQKADLKRKMATKEVIQKAEQRLRMIAFDISTHYQGQLPGNRLQGPTGSRFPHQRHPLPTLFSRNMAWWRQKWSFRHRILGEEKSLLEEEDTPLVNALLDRDDETFR